MEMNATSLKQLLITWISDWTNLSVQPDLDLFFDLGLDSLHYAELISKIEAEIGVTLDFSTLDNWESVRTINGIIEFVFKNN
jgi:acyl carrier protein